MSDSRQTPDQIEADIERQREELSATVTQLHAKLDVKTRARVKLNEIKGQATTDTGRPRPDIAAAAVVAAVALVGLLVWRARR